MKRIKDDLHPSLDIIESDGVELSGKKVVLCVTGSVAAYKAIELARLLMRHGADVRCVISNATTKLVQPDYFRWATGNNVVTKLTGNLEHIKLGDYHKSDIIIIYPSTANTLSKLANGIDDTPVSTVLTVGFGSKIPIVMALAMHKAMYENPAIKKNIKFLQNKIDFITPNITEGKAKVAEPKEVLEYILKKFGFSTKLSKKKVLIAAGPTVEQIDPMRVITNQSSGKTGVLLAYEMLSAGAATTMVYGPGLHTPPKGARVISVKTAKQMISAIKKELTVQKYDIVVMAAAIADYTPTKKLQVKIKSKKKQITIKLKQTPKIINQIKQKQQNVFLVGFKAEANISKKELEKRGKAKLLESNADMIIANDIGNLKYIQNPKYNEILIIDKEKMRSVGWQKKEKIANIIRKEIEKRIKDDKQ